MKDQPEILRDAKGRVYNVFGSSSGGMGTVYFCRTDHLEGPVAVKLPTRLDKLQQALFRREGLVWLHLGELETSFLVPLQEVTDMAGVPGLVMPYYPAGNLRSLIGARESHFDLLAVTQIIIGLRQLSDRNVSHRDLKPENVLIDQDGHCRLADFGISAAPFVSSKQIRGSGTLPYMSPEQIADAEPDGSEDLWALGVIAWELLFQFHPFMGGDLQSVASRIVKGVLPSDVRAAAPSVPREVEVFLSSCLAPEKGDRFGSLQDAAEVWDEVLVAADSYSPRNSGRPSLFDPKTDSGWTGLFFPERIEAEGKEQLRFKYAVLVSLRNAESAYDLGEYRAAVQELESSFGGLFDDKSIYKLWIEGRLPPGGFQRGKDLEWTWQPTYSDVEQAVRCVLKSLVALLTEEPNASERRPAKRFARSIVRGSAGNRHTRQLAAQVLALTGDFGAARAALDTLIKEDPSDPHPWNVLAANELMAGSDPEVLRDIARSAVASGLIGPDALYVQAHLWAVAGDFEAGVPFAMKALLEEDLSYALVAELAGILWNGGATEEAIRVLDLLENEASQVPQVQRLVKALEDELASWRNRQG